MVRQSGGGQTPDSPQCHVRLSDPLASKQTAALNHQVPGAHKQAQAPEAYIAHPPGKGLQSRNQPSSPLGHKASLGSSQGLPTTYMSDVRLKILHPEGPDHKPEFNRAKPPAQGDLPVLEQRSTVPWLETGTPAPPTHTPELYHLLSAQPSRDAQCHHDARGCC